MSNRGLEGILLEPRETRGRKRGSEGACKKLLERVIGGFVYSGRKIKFGLAAAAAAPLTYAALEIARSTAIIPATEYSVVYAQHALISMPMLYCMSIATSYLDISITQKIVGRAYERIKSARGAR